MLCTFCDDALPPDVSPRYWEVCDILTKEGKAQPSAKNPGHIDLPICRAFEACWFHQESRRSSITQGIAKGYPKTIDFTAVPSRLRVKLTAIKEAILHPCLHQSLERFRHGEQPVKSLGDRMLAAEVAHAG